MRRTGLPLLLLPAPALGRGNRGRGGGRNALLLRLVVAPVRPRGVSQPGWTGGTGGPNGVGGTGAG